MQTIQRVMLKNTIQNQDRTFKNVQVTNKKAKKEKQEDEWEPKETKENKS